MLSLKEYHTKTKANEKIRFWVVLMICALLVASACWFAYARTRKEMKQNMNTALKNELAAAVPETDVPRPAETFPPSTNPPQTEPPQTIPAAEKVTEPPTQPMTIATLPLETQAVAVNAPAETIPEPLTNPPMPTEIPTEAVGLIEPTEPETLPPPPAPTEMTETSETVPETEPELPIERNPVYPMAGKILQSFSDGELVKSTTTGVWQTHNGIDISGALGDEVHAMDAGIVKQITQDPLWGIVVVIDHKNGIFSRYCGLNTGLSVSEGDTVTAGMTIGALGDTAEIEGAMETHLHFEVMQGEKYIDPVKYLTGE